MKRLFLILLTFACVITGWAYDIEIDGIYYNMDRESHMLEVTHSGHDYLVENSYAGDVVIPSVVNIDGVEYTVVRVGPGTFQHCTGLTSVTIPNSVTEIGNSAFWMCEELTSVNIPESIKSIGAFVFGYCMGLTSINIPNSVTTLLYDFVVSLCTSTM